MPDLDFRPSPPRLRVVADLEGYVVAVDVKSLMLAVVVLVASQAHSAISLHTNSLIVCSQQSGMLRQLDPVTGTVIGTLQLRTAGGANYSSIVGLAYVEGSLYVSDGSFANRVDATTGVLTPLYTVFSEGVGSRDNLLLTQGDYSLQLRTVNGDIVSSLEVDGDMAGVPPEVSGWYRDAGWSSIHSRYVLMADTHSNPDNFWLQTFTETGQYTGTEGYYQRPANYYANGFDIVGDQRWVALKRDIETTSQVRLYQRGTPNALRSFTLPFGGLTDVVYIVPAPAGVLVGGVAGLAALRRRR